MINLQNIDTCPNCGGPATFYEDGHCEAITDAEADTEIERLRKWLTDILEISGNAYPQDGTCSLVADFAKAALAGEAFYRDAEKRVIKDA